MTGGLRRKHRNLLLAWYLILVVRPLVAAELLSVTVERARPGFEVRATLGIDAPATLCYAVLADFDHIDEFIPGMKSSEVLSAPDAPIRLHQVGDAGIGPFHTAIDVTLAVTTDAPTRIDFARVAGNLEQMNGSWIVAGDHARCGIAYRALIEPRFWVPPLIGPRLMRTQVEQQMQGLLQEIRRRAAGSQQPPAASPGSDDAGHARAVRQGG